MMIASPFWGYLADRFGRKIMVERALFGGAFILGLMAFVRSAEELVMLRALQGMITGTVAAANALVAAFVPRERIGYAMGLLQVGIGAGFALGPLAGGVVADIFGYRATFYMTVALLLIAGGMVLLGVREEFVPAKLTAGKRAGFLSEWRNILGTPGVMTIYSTRFMSQLGRMMILPIAPLFIQVLLPDEASINSFTGLVMGTAWVTTTISAVYLGRLGDRIGHRRIVIVCCLITALFYLPQAMVSTGWQLLLFQALAGLAAGGIIPGISALLANDTKQGHEGAVFGLDSSISAGARALAPLLAVSVAILFNLRASFIATAILFFTAGTLAILKLPKG
jgi:DHA1 family multidrug resistance protein-like MFS transporter